MSIAISVTKRIELRALMMCWPNSVAQFYWPARYWRPLMLIAILFLASCSERGSSPIERDVAEPTPRRLVRQHPRVENIDISQDPDIHHTKDVNAQYLSEFSDLHVIESCWPSQYILEDDVKIARTGYLSSILTNGLLPLKPDCKDLERKNLKVEELAPSLTAAQSVEDPVTYRQAFEDSLPVYSIIDGAVCRGTVRLKKPKPAQQRRWVEDIRIFAPLDRETKTLLRSLMSDLNTENVLGAKSIGLVDHNPNAEIVGYRTAMACRNRDSGDGQCQPSPSKYRCSDDSTFIRNSELASRLTSRRLSYFDHGSDFSHPRLAGLSGFTLSDDRDIHAAVCFVSDSVSTDNIKTPVYRRYRPNPRQNAVILARCVTAILGLNPISVRKLGDSVISPDGNRKFKFNRSVLKAIKDQYK